MDYSNNIEVDGINTHYHETGQGETVLLIHGSGSRGNSLGKLAINDSEAFQRISMSLHQIWLGSDYTDRPENVEYNVETWTNHLISFC